MNNIGNGWFNGSIELYMVHGINQQCKLKLTPQNLHFPMNLTKCLILTGYIEFIRCQQSTTHNCL